MTYRFPTRNIVIGCLAYLSTLSLWVFAVACVVAVIGSMVYHCLTRGRMLESIREAATN